MATATKRELKYAVACLSLLVMVSVVAGFALSGKPKAESAAALATETRLPQLAEIHEYRTWTRVNPEPVLISPQVSALCARPFPPPPADDSRSPHAKKLITVYVNEIGRTAMLSELKPKFPPGSVIVKEKLAPERKEEPELLTVMVKRERGFNPAVGDWEYMVTNGDGTKLEARGKLESCQACHVSMRQTDFIYRSYLTEELRSDLR
jgi:hypothetical protein